MNVPTEGTHPKTSRNQKGPNMAASLRQIAANRVNSQNSSGPKTAIGKARSRFNGVKHGLCSKTLVLPTENAQEFADEFQAWMDDWKPPTAARKALVERAASSVCRLRRCVRIENTTLAFRGEVAVNANRSNEASRIATAVKNLKKSPYESIKTLCTMRKGIEQLLELWEVLLNASEEASGWSNVELHHETLYHLFGWTEYASFDDVGGVSETSSDLLKFNHAEKFRNQILCTADEAVDNARAINNCIRREMARLRVVKEGLLSTEDYENKLRDLAYFDVSAEGQRLSRYEAMLDRTLRSAIKDLTSLSKSNEDLRAILEAAEDEAQTEANSVATSTEIKPCIAASAPSPTPAPSNPPASAPTNEPVFIEEGHRQADRDRDGRIWPVLDDLDAPNLR